MNTPGPRLVLLGKQGSGKGTQAALLSEHYHVDHLSTGDLFRAAAASETAAGLEAKQYMDAGELVPDETVIKVVKEHFTPEFIRCGFILDGFPRTRRQAEELEVVLDSHPLDVVLHLEIPTAIVLERIAGRRVCENCGATYRLDMPPKHDWTCDVCGGRVVQRDDDTEEAIQRRLELFRDETEPIIDYYEQLGRLAVVDAVGEGDEVFKRLVGEIDQRFDPTHR